MRSALFVDFDNVFTGLRRLSPAYAETFARQPSRWLDWLVATLQPPAGAQEGAQRRVLVRRCYLNPVMYQGYRIGFSRAGFEIVDCPPMTSAGKTSTDIHMVLDIIDVLQAQTHYDEFIVFSADADFTPVLRKLRREDRRTTMFAAGATSASYDACADLIIDPEAFIHEALGFDEEEAASAAPTAPSTESLLAQAEELVWAMVDAADQPVPLPALTKALAVRIPGLPATEWAGKGTFLALLKSLPLEPLRIDRELNAMLDPRRLSDAQNGTAAARPAPTGMIGRPESRPPPTTPDQVARLLSEEVAASDRPIPVARLAQIVRARFPGIETTWLGQGSWKKLLESLHPAKVKIEWHQLAGWALDPDRHVLALASAPAAVQNPAAATNPQATSIARLLDAVDLPLLDPAKYRAQLEGLAQALDVQPYSLSAVTKFMRDHCLRQDQAVSREQCLRLLRTLVFNGFDPESSAHSFEDLVATTCGVIVAACQREGVPIDEADREALLGWMTSQGEAAHS
jgi:hypothetical protein